MYDGGRHEAQSWQENYFVSLTSLCRYKRHFAVINFTLVNWFTERTSGRFNDYRT